MKILHISCIAPPDTGGIGASASEMVSRLNTRGVEATLVAPARRSSKGEADAAWIKRLSAPLRFGNAAVLAGLKSVMQQYDVIHLHYPFFGTAEAVAQDCLFMRKPLVMTFHMDAKAGGISGMMFEMYRMAVQPAIFRAAHRIFVSSLDYADHSSLSGFHKAHPERLIELPFGVDTERFAPEKKKWFGLPADARVIGFVGGMDAAHAFKGVPVLLKAMAILPSDVHALLVGDGAQHIAFEHQAKELGIADRCHFVGRVSHDQLPDAYHAMNVFAFPSTSTAEAFGLVSVEAMACGVPVVASDLPGVRTVGEDGVTGLLVPPSDAVALAAALRRILDDSSLRDRMGRASRERVLSRYSWDRQIDRLIQTYREVAPNA